MYGLPARQGQQQGEQPADQNEHDGSHGICFDQPLGCQIYLQIGYRAGAEFRFFFG